MAALYPNIYQRGRKTTLLTQEEAAERLGISAETLKRYEGGRLTPSDETVAIDDAERPEFDDIVQDLRETIAAAYQVIYADDAKKERPEAGTSKRSRPQSRSSENHCKHSISQKQTKVNTFRGEARA